MPDVRLVLTAMSAADFYRRRFPAFVAPEPSTFELDRPCAYKEEDVWSLAPFWVDPAFVAPESGALHVLTRSAAQRGNSRNVRAHVWSGELPKGVLVEYNANMAVASPGFTFLQLATELDFGELVAYGDELCGYYSLDSTDERGYRERKVPLITLDELKAFISLCVGMRGYRKAIQVLPHIIGGSPNPDSTKIAMLGCLSFHYGGYSLPMPHLNESLKLSKRGSLIAGNDCISVGVCWPEYSTCFVRVDEAIDSPSKDDPLNPAFVRSVALEMSGYSVVKLANGQIEDGEAFESSIMEAAEAVGRRIPKAKSGPTPQRTLLRESVLGWHAANGHAS